MFLVMGLRLVEVLKLFVSVSGIIRKGTAFVFLKIFFKDLKLL